MWQLVALLVSLGPLAEFGLDKRVEVIDGKAMIASAELESVWLAISATFRLSA